MFLDEAKLLANVNERAQWLFENGYRARWTSDSIVEITTPSERVYEVNLERQICSCSFFVCHEGKYKCKHLIGCFLLLLRIQQEQLDRLAQCFNPKHAAQWPEWTKALAQTQSEVAA